MAGKMKRLNFEIVFTPFTQIFAHVSINLKKHKKSSLMTVVPCRKGLFMTFLFLYLN